MQARAADNHPPPEAPLDPARQAERLWRLSGPVISGLLIALIELLAKCSVKIPNLSVLLLATILYSTFAGGFVAGLVSGVITLSYYVYAESITGALLHHTSVGLERILSTGAATALAIALVGQLRVRLDGLLVRERRLRVEADAAREQMTAILESITDGFFAVDREWRYVYVNGAAEHLVKRPREHLLGRNIWETFPKKP